MYFIVGEVGFIHDGKYRHITYDFIIYTCIVKVPVDFMCFILISFFKFFFNEYREDKISMS